MKLRIGRARIFLGALLALVCATTGFGGPSYELGGHVAARSLRSATLKGRRAPHSRLSLAVALRPRDPEGLADLVQRLYDPSDSQYHQFLSTEQFRERFGASARDVNDAVQYLESRGLHVRRVHDNNLVLSVETETAAAENAFQVRINDYLDREGRAVHGPDRDPVVLAEIGAKFGAVAGLSSFGANRRHHLKKSLALDPRAIAPRATVGSYMTPAKIRSGFGLNGVAQTGIGETVALFELDGYNVSDINAYASYFGITVPTITNVLVDGYSGAAGANADEVTLDIELVMAIAPAAGIRVYEGPLTDAGVLDTYSRIASDNLAKIVSISWGSAESQNTASFLNAENAIFLQMAAQGQSVFAASGDSGAYDDSAHPSTLAVDDPSSQPYVTGVGGTTLTLNGANGYASESSWGLSASAEGGGGGISGYWPIPAWQSGYASASNRGSSTMRMVPDVALDANPSTGYPIYSGGAWYAFGGTSAAAPLWAGFLALVNQARVAASLSRVGFATPSLYQLGQSSLFSSVFHDIADSSTNLYYPAVTGYDLSTGWGSFNGAPMLNALSAASLPPLAPQSMSLASGAGQITASWAAASGATSYTVYRATSSSGVYVVLASGVAGTSYVDTVAAGTYYYYVVAVNGAGSSKPSTTVSAAPNVAAPGAPGNLTATVL